MGAISNDWLGPMGAEFKKPYYAKLYRTVLNEYQTKQIFPASDDIWSGTWAEFFCSTKCCNPTVTVKYLSRIGV